MINSAVTAAVAVAAVVFKYISAMLLLTVHNPFEGVRNKSCSPLNQTSAVGVSMLESRIQLRSGTSNCAGCVVPLPSIVPVKSRRTLELCIV